MGGGWVDVYLVGQGMHYESRPMGILPHTNINTGNDWCNYGLRPERYTTETWLGYLRLRPVSSSAVDKPGDELWNISTEPPTRYAATSSEPSH